MVINGNLCIHYLLQQVNFLSTDFMAVATDSTVSSSAVDGAINIVKIKTVGSSGQDGTHAPCSN